MIPYVFAPSTLAKSSEVNKNFEVLSHSGLIMAYAGSTSPEGWLICDGSAVSRTTYATLFSLIGTTYGVGDGSTTFNIPNIKGRAIVGYDSSQSEFNIIGKTGGAKTHLLTTSEIPSHTHGSATLSGSFNVHGSGSATVLSGASGGVVSVGTARSQYRSGGSNTNGATSYDAININATHTHTSVGSDTPHNNLQPYIVFNYLIKV